MDKQDTTEKNWVQHLILYFAIAAFIMVLFRTVWMVNYIPSASMEPTLQIGDIVWSTRYDRNSISRNDIIIFQESASDILYIKRVIGLPGEIIEVTADGVYADGTKLQEPFIKEPMQEMGTGLYTVPNDSVFVLGDNRNNSFDSRFLDGHYIKLDQIRAKTKGVILPFEHAGALGE